ncbi:hypothetical protein ME763_31900 [Streptomyces murinus]|uniref:hypothetical protein n=1 Tax=Streptomyces murinus TaxID=33900 RepID=UPI00117DDCB4|nr:hypothetical protein [Streptomyces murinus]WDO09895.1 hypothetical protein ME763_31900 [Streptomyces murinus]
MQSSIAHTVSPDPRLTYTPPLDIARAAARQALNEAPVLDSIGASSLALARAFGHICESLRQVLDALDAEDGRRA